MHCILLLIAVLLLNYTTARLVRRLPVPRRPVRSRLRRLRRVEVALVSGALA